MRSKGGAVFVQTSVLIGCDRFGPFSRLPPQASTEYRVPRGRVAYQPSYRVVMWQQPASVVVAGRLLTTNAAYGASEYARSKG